MRLGLADKAVERFHTIASQAARDLKTKIVASEPLGRAATDMAYWRDQRSFWHGAQDMPKASAVATECLMLINEVIPQMVTSASSEGLFRLVANIEF